MYSARRLGTCLLILAAAGVAAFAADDKSPSERWEGAVKSFAAADRKNPPPQNAILFIGSSSVARWKSLARDFPEYQVINRGFGGSQIADAVYYADRIVIPYRPRMIVLRSGNNDINAGKSPEQVFEDFKGFVAKVRAKLPGTRIVFISINPCPLRWANFSKESNANQLIRAYCTPARNLDYVDIVPGMLGPDGKPRPELYVSDRLHPNADGYKIWVDKLRRHLAK